MTYGTRVYLVSHPLYRGIIVGFTYQGEIIVEWDDAPGEPDTVDPFDIDEVSMPENLDDFSPKMAMKRKLNDILGV